MIPGQSPGKPRITFFQYILYNLNFTTFVSGPIQRYEQFSEYLFVVDIQRPTLSEIWLQVQRIILGFFKVNVVAQIFYAIQQDAIGQMHPAFLLDVRAFAALKIAISFPLYLYGNFSGYIDIVIALANLMGVRLPENFNRPFSASSFLEFWSRWHMTLSNWIKSYVYNPLLIWLTRRVEANWIQPYLGVFCFFVAFFLVGIWHGRTSEFVVFGLLTGGGVAGNKLWQTFLTRILSARSYRALAKRNLYVAAGRGLTFTWFAFSLIWFWADWKEISDLSATLDWAEWIGVWLAVWLSMALVLEVWERLRTALLNVRGSDGPIVTGLYARVIYASALGLTALAISGWVNQPPPVIVYKTF
jgi:D-alanyl-lipoteichoic acid acyltransferase DltB (MBOAT superfamily)